MFAAWTPITVTQATATKNLSQSKLQSNKVTKETNNKPPAYPSSYRQSPVDRKSKTSVFNLILFTKKSLLRAMKLNELTKHTSNKSPHFAECFCQTISFFLCHNSLWCFFFFIQLLFMQNNMHFMKRATNYILSQNIVKCSIVPEYKTIYNYNCMHPIPRGFQWMNEWKKKHWIWLIFRLIVFQI